jgi:hypothetical protein
MAVATRRACRYRVDRGVVTRGGTVSKRRMKSAHTERVLGYIMFPGRGDDPKSNRAVGALSTTF